MAEGPSGKAQDRSSFEIDTTVPNAARVYDYLLGGTDNFEVDRAAAEANNAVLPGGIAAAQAEVRANRDFLGRAVRWLVDTAGVRQFLDIGTGIPNADNVHAVAQAAAPESRIVCVDYDPVVLAHAHTLLKSTPEGAAAFIPGDLREPGRILATAARRSTSPSPRRCSCWASSTWCPTRTTPTASSAGWSTPWPRAATW